MHCSKICFKCQKEKELSEFYKHKRMFDGHLNKCKDCTKIDAHKHRELNIDYILEYDKQRSNLPKRVEARDIYSKTEQGIKSSREAKKKWLENNKVKRAAQIIYRNRIRYKPELKKTECEACKVSGIRLEAHHDDYSKPMEVRYLCSKCHRQWHKINGEGKLF